MTDTALLGHTGQPGADEPGDLPGYGPVPADLAREIALGTTDTSGTDPDPTRPAAASGDCSCTHAPTS